VRELREPRDRTLVLWTVASALAIATHYFAAFVVIPEAIWLLLAARDRRRPAIAIAVLVAVGAALLPLLLRQRSLDLTSFITQSSLLRRLVLVPKQFVVGYASPVQVLVIVLAACFALVALALLYARSNEAERRGGRVAATIGLAGLAIPLVLAIAGADYFNTRNMLATWLPLMLVLAAGLGARRSGRTGLAATAGLCAIGLYVSIAVWVNPAYQRENNRGVARALGPATVPRALVITPVSATVPLQYYMQPFRTSPFPVKEIDLVALPQRSSLFSGARPVKLAPQPHQPPAGGFRIVEQKQTPSYTLIRFRSDTPTTILPPALLFNRLDPRQANVVYQR